MPGLRSKSSPPKPLAEWTRREMVGYVVVVTLFQGFVGALAAWVASGEGRYPRTTSLRVGAAVVGTFLAGATIMDWVRVAREWARRGRRAS